MNVRKIQKIGGTYFLSVPKAWAKSHGLAKGSIVTLTQRADGRILIDPQYSNNKTVSTTHIHLSPYLEREITGKYLLGFDVLEVTSGERLKPEIYDRVRKIIQRLIGIEIVEEDAYKIVLQCLLESSALPPERIVRREHLLASSMQKDVLTALAEGNVPLASSIIERDEEVDRLYFLLVRLLRTIILDPSLSDTLNLSLIDCLDYRLMASHIEAIADYSQEIANNIIEFSDTTLPTTILETLNYLGEVSYQMHQNAFNALLSNNLQLVSEVLVQEQTSKKIIRKLDECLTGESFEIITYASTIASALTKICDFSVDLADLVMP